jgi:hypothetical protein
MPYDEDSYICQKSIELIPLLVNFILFIFIIVRVFKIIINANSEPTNRDLYLAVDPSYYYTEGDFCFDNYEDYKERGAFQLFNLHIKQIKQFSTATLVTIFTLIASVVASGVFQIIKKHHDFYDNNWPICLICSFFWISSILSIIFGSILAYHYYASNFDDFVEFSKCKFIAKNFKSDYNFVFVIKKDFVVPYALIIISQFFECLKSSVEFSKH